MVIPISERIRFSMSAAWSISELSNGNCVVAYSVYQGGGTAYELYAKIFNDQGILVSDLGKVMPIVMQKGGSKIDGKIANQILRELLE